MIIGVRSMSCGRPKERGDRGAKPRELLKYVVRESFGAARLARLEMTDPTLIIEQVVIRYDRAGDHRLAESSRPESLGAFDETRLRLRPWSCIRTATSVPTLPDRRARWSEAARRWRPRGEGATPGHLAARRPYWRTCLSASRSSGAARCAPRAEPQWPTACPGHLSQRVYQPHLQGVDPDSGCDRDDRRRAQPDVGPFLQRTVDGPPDSLKVVDDDCTAGGIHRG
jgi:hypothetical protein